MRKVMTVADPQDIEVIPGLNVSLLVTNFDTGYPIQAQ